MGSWSELSENEKLEVMKEMKQRILVANVQDLLTKITEKCFTKCISKPGTSLDSSEQKCISMCMHRFMDSWKLVSRTYGTRLQNEQNRT